MATQLNDNSIIVNNEQIAYTADSVSSKDGLGDATVRNAVVGGGQTQSVYAEDLSSKKGMIKFSMPSTEGNIALVRSWKLNKNNNVVELVGPISTKFGRLFTGAAILGDPEANYATDGDIEVEFESQPAQ